MIRVSRSNELQQLTPAGVEAEQRQGALILDIRTAEQFASFHIHGAVQIGLKGPFASWAALLIKPTQKLLLVAEDAASAHEAQSRLVRARLSRVAGYTLADKAHWEQQGIPVSSVSITWWRDVCCRVRALQLIDVRSRAEWLKGHLPGAISLPLLTLNSAASSVDLSKPSLLYCQEGYRATTAASMLLRESTASVGILLGSEEAWQVGQSRPDPLEDPLGAPLEASLPAYLCGSSGCSTAR